MPVIETQLLNENVGWKKRLNPTGSDYSSSRRKRALDVTGALALLPFALPLVTAAAVAIKLEDGGPIIYVARVVGRNGKEFGMKKLRSMVTDAEEIRRSAGESNFIKREDDPRITVVGRRLRRSSLDELPQLINVLRGDMSLVGPRPVTQDTMDYMEHEPYLAEAFMKWREGYSSVRPGGLGPKLGLGRAAVTHSLDGLKAGMEAESDYISRASLAEDIRWIIKGFIAVLSQKGAC